MVAFLHRRPAPQGQNSLAVYEGAGAALYKPEPLVPLTNQAGVQSQLNYGFQQTFYPQTSPTGPSGWQQTADFLTNKGFQSLLTTGFSTYQMQLAKQEAERQRRIAQQRSDMEVLLAQESIKNTQQERDIHNKLAALEMERQQSDARLRSALGSNWLIPAALFGGGALVLFLILSRKKS
jgi:hypothetical protein